MGGIKATAGLQSSPLPPAHIPFAKTNLQRASDIREPRALGTAGAALSRRSRVQEDPAEGQEVGTGGGCLGDRHGGKEGPVSILA